MPGLQFLIFTIKQYKKKCNLTHKHKAPIGLELHMQSLNALQDAKKEEMETRADNREMHEEGGYSKASVPPP